MQTSWNTLELMASHCWWLTVQNNCLWPVECHWMELKCLIGFTCYIFIITPPTSSSHSDCNIHCNHHWQTFSKHIKLLMVCQKCRLLKILLPSKLICVGRSQHHLKERCTNYKQVISAKCFSFFLGMSSYLFFAWHLSSSVLPLTLSWHMPQYSPLIRAILYGLHIPLSILVH